MHLCSYFGNCLSIPSTLLTHSGLIKHWLTLLAATYQRLTMTKNQLLIMHFINNTHRMGGVYEMHLQYTVHFPSNTYSIYCIGWFEVKTSDTYCAIAVHAIHSIVLYFCVLKQNCIMYLKVRTYRFVYSNLADAESRVTIANFHLVLYLIMAAVSLASSLILQKPLYSKRFFSFYIHYIFMW